MKRTIAFAAAGAVLLLGGLALRQTLSADGAGAGPAALSPAAGTEVRLFYTREALGVANQKVPIGPDVETVERERTFTVGRFKAMDAEWIVLGDISSDRVEYWVPRRHVLLLRVLRKD